MDRKGQSKIESTLNCNYDGVYELKENGAIEIINEVECIMALRHEEL